MWCSPRALKTVIITIVVALRSTTQAVAQDAASAGRLGLADLVNYRAALAGKPTADNVKTSDPPLRVVFKDIWNRPEAFRGRRITIEGRTQRIFRQGAVGDFPALAEIWIASPAGDPFCLVTPQKTDAANNSSSKVRSGTPAVGGELPEPGQLVRFTGTFLKLIRYAAGDGDRVAPLVVGDEPPVYLRNGSKTSNRTFVATHAAHSSQTTRSGTWLLGLAVALLVTGAFVIRYSRVVIQRIERRNQRRRVSASLGSDPPLEFVEIQDKP